MSAVLYGTPPSDVSAFRAFVGEYTCRGCGKLFPSAEPPSDARCDTCVRFDRAASYAMSRATEKDPAVVVKRSPEPPPSFPHSCNDF